MDKDEIFYLSVDILTQLISIPRLSCHEDKACTFLKEVLEKYNDENFTIIRKGNNLVLKPYYFDSSKKTVLLNSHIDTVKAGPSWTFDPYKPYLDNSNDKLTGLGSNDAGASLVSLIGTFLYYQCNKIQSSYNLVFAATAEEEISGKEGFDSVKDILPSIDFAIVGEPTGMNPAVAEKGLMVIDADIIGKSGHAARDEGDNAIYMAMPVISALRALRFPEVSEWLGPVKISVTQIQAGTQHNVVPAVCSMVVDVRTTDCYSNEQTFDIMARSVPEFCILKPRSFRLNPSFISLSNPIVQRLITLGRTPFGSPTLSDQALMPWESVKLGPGESSRSHTADEFIYLFEIREALETYIALLA